MQERNQNADYRKRKVETDRAQSKRKIGFEYEERAAAYLKEKGYGIIKQNFYTRWGEIDLIVRDGAYLVFVEVKYRSDSRGGHPLEVVDRHKQNRIRRSAQFFLMRYGFPENTACRFDVVGILGEEIMHIENAFY